MSKNGATVVMGELPPQDLNIESAILGAIMLDKGAFAEANTHIHAEVFYKPSNRLIFKAMTSLFDKNENIDMLTVVTECTKLGFMAEIGGPYEVTLLTQNVVSSAHIEMHCRILLELYLKRQGVEIANKFLFESFDRTVDVFDSFNRADNSIINAQEGAMKGMIKDMSYFAGKVYEEYETVKATGVLGIETGIAPFDRLMCGLVAPDLLIVAARPGQGKCLGKGTKILMYDGTFKKVEDIVTGDVLMGDDSTPRNVISTISGFENMYLVNQIKGISYRVNESHILSLKVSRNECGRKNGDVVNISVREYLTKSVKWKSNHKGYKTAIEFGYKNLPIPPYMLGIWLGDGSVGRPIIHKPDKEIEDYIKNYCKEINHNFHIYEPLNKCKAYSISNRGGVNLFTKNLKDLGIYKCKRIPHIYLTSSREQRIELLAGLLDTDGHCEYNGYDIIQKSKELIDDIKFLCDSLGFMTKYAAKKSSIKSNNFKGLYHRVQINGDFSELPIKIPRKKPAARKCIKNWRMTGISVELDGHGEYFGFEIDGNRLFVLEDMTVTHNTAWALSLTKNITCDRGIPGAWFSYEMSGVQLTRRLVSQMSNAVHSAIRNGKLYNDKEIEFINAVSDGANLKLYIEDDPTLNIRDLRTRATILKRKNDIKYIVVDYLQLMPALDGKGKTREQVVSEISRGLKSLAKELNIPIIALAQLSRAVETRPDKMPQLSDLRESGGIEQDADGVLFLMRPEYYGMNENHVQLGNVEYSPRNLCIGIVGKNRHGETCNFPMYFDGPIMRIGTHPEDESQRQVTQGGFRPMQVSSGPVVHRQLPPENDTF